MYSSYNSNSSNVLYLNNVGNVNTTTIVGSFQGVSSRRPRRYVGKSRRAPSDHDSEEKWEDVSGDADDDRARHDNENLAATISGFVSSTTDHSMSAAQHEIYAQRQAEYDQRQAERAHRHAEQARLAAQAQIQAAFTQNQAPYAQQYPHMAQYYGMQPISSSWSSGPYYRTISTDQCMPNCVGSYSRQIYDSTGYVTIEQHDCKQRRATRPSNTHAHQGKEKPATSKDASGSKATSTVYIAESSSAARCSGYVERERVDEFGVSVWESRLCGHRECRDQEKRAGQQPRVDPESSDSGSDREHI